MDIRKIAKNKILNFEDAEQPMVLHILKMNISENMLVKI